MAAMIDNFTVKVTGTYLAQPPQNNPTTVVLCQQGSPIMVRIAAGAAPIHIHSNLAAAGGAGGGDDRDIAAFQSIVIVTDTLHLYLPQGVTTPATATVTLFG
jgi:hypothetical protein